MGYVTYTVVVEHDELAKADIDRLMRDSMDSFTDRLDDAGDHTWSTTVTDDAGDVVCAWEYEAGS